MIRSCDDVEAALGPGRRSQRRRVVRSPDGEVGAGAVASRSDQVVGVSNVFARDGGPDAAWPVVLDAVHTLFPVLPVVGYEHGDDLAVALRHGFEPVGPLRIWLHG